MLCVGATVPRPLSPCKRGPVHGGQFLGTHGLALLTPRLDLLRARSLQNERIWWLDAVVAIVVTIALALYSIPVLVKHRWWRKDFWKTYVGA